MKAFVSFGRLQFEVEGENAKELFEKLGPLYDTFDMRAQLPNGETSDDIRPVTRIVVDPKNPKKTYTYHEWKCNQHPYPRLSLGEKMEGGELFPKRKDSEGNFLENGGWVTYQKENV